MKKKNWLCLFLAVFFIISGSNVSAEEISLDSDTILLFTPPKSWVEREVPKSMKATKKIWQTEDDFAHIEIKTIAAQDSKIITTEDFGELVAESFDKAGEEMGIKVLGDSETVTLNNTEWKKISTSTHTLEGVPTRLETYYIVKNNAALQIKITGPEQNWQKILNEIKTFLESVAFK